MTDTENYGLKARLDKDPQEIADLIALISSRISPRLKDSTGYDPWRWSKINAPAGR